MKTTSADKRRWARGLLATLLAALCTLLAGCEQETVLLADITESDANQVVAALDRAHVSARKQAGKEGAVSVLVEASQVAFAVSTLQSEGLPPERHAQMGEVFRKEGLISSPLEERARYLWALSQELAETVVQIDGVIKARVHVVLPERASGGTPPQPSSASVFIKYRPGYNMQPVVPQVKQLVSTSIPGLTDERVTVVLVVSQPPLLSGPAQAAVAARTSVSASPIASANVAAASQGMGQSRVTAMSATLVGLIAFGGVGFALRDRLGWRRAAELPPVRQEPQATS